VAKKTLPKIKWRQYLIAGILGAIPGCLGAFTMVAMFSHRLVSFGALVTTMIATSGDEAFVMFAMFPKMALLLTVIILVVGILAGYLTDKFYNPKKHSKKFLLICSLCTMNLNANVLKEIKFGSIYFIHPYTD